MIGCGLGSIVGVERRWQMLELLRVEKKVFMTASTGCCEQGAIGGDPFLRSQENGLESVKAFILYIVNSGMVMPMNKMLILPTPSPAVTVVRSPCNNPLHQQPSGLFS